MIYKEALPEPGDDEPASGDRPQVPLAPVQDAKPKPVEKTLAKPADKPADKKN
jgi:hypothetical protein